MVEESDYIQDCIDRLHSPAGWWTKEWLLGRDLSEETIDTAALGYDEGAKAITIPYYTHGHLVTHRFRHLQGDTKYTTPRGGGTHLYMVENTSQPKVWICEGEFDALILQQMGYNSVGVPGTNAFNTAWRYLFAYCDEVSIVFDGDDAGSTAAQKVSSLLIPLVSRIRMIRMDQGMDVNEMYKKNESKLRGLVE